MIIEAVYSHLKADATLMALCSSLYPQLRPLRVDQPFMLYSLDSDERMRMLDGTENLYRRAIITVDVYAKSLVTAEAIADAVESSLIDFTGTLGTTSPAVTVDHSRLERRGPYIFETDTEYHHIPLEFLIGYE